MKADVFNKELSTSDSHAKDLAKCFVKLMRKVKVRAALRLLSRNGSSLLDLNASINKRGDKTVLDEL